MKSFCCLLFFLLFSSCFEDKSRMVVDGKMEPPAPDESKNNKTIGGIDSNNDGVRDDIERWINRKFPREENYNKRMAWKQRSKSIRNVLLNADSKELAIQYLYEWNKAGDCFAYVYTFIEKDSSNEMFEIGRKLLDLNNNTQARMKKWDFADKSFAGKAYASPPATKMIRHCKFEIKIK